MFFLIFCAFICSGCLSITSLITSLVFIWSISTTYTYDLAIIYNMPVITRSQSRKLIVTPAEPSVSSTNLTTSLCGISNQLSDSTTVSPFQLLSSTEDPSSPGTANVVLSPSSDFFSSDPSSFLLVSNYLEISNSNKSSFENLYSPQSSALSHNSSMSNFSKMEHDCDEKAMGSTPPSDLLDITKLLQTMTVQLTSQNTKLSHDFHQVMQTNEVFKQEVRLEMDELRSMILELKQESSSSQVHISTMQDQVSPSPVPTCLPCGISNNTQSHGSSAPTSTNPQTQMMLLCAESFSKFSTVLTDNQESLAKLSTALTDKPDSKAECPKFSGDQKKFRAWYLAIMAQISLSPWVELYDPVKNDILQTTSNSILNGKLYSKLLLALEGNALKYVVSRKHLHANGLLLLQELVQTYRPKNVPEVIAFKTSQFWGNTRRFPSETIDEYYNRFHELLDELEDADEPISVKSDTLHIYSWF
jgi:hypothetical protein